MVSESHAILLACRVLAKSLHRGQGGSLICWGARTDVLGLIAGGEVDGRSGRDGRSVVAVPLVGMACLAELDVELLAARGQGQTVGPVGGERARPRGQS
jgi:hypothetical protein